ncbi:MAG: 2TM domain-containing protein [Myxococcota bacterium]
MTATPVDFSQAQVQKILQRAMSRSTRREEGLTREELEQTATELGISREALEAAIEEDADERDVTEQRETWLAKHKRGLRGSFILYLVVNAMLFLLDARTPGGPWWFWPALGWGVALAFQVRALFHPPQFKSRRLTGRLGAQIQAFGKVLEEGAHALGEALGHGARALGEQLEKELKTRPEGPRSEDGLQRQRTPRAVQTERKA